MEKKEFKKKLSLNKVTISNLNEKDLNNIKGGQNQYPTETMEVDSCYVCYKPTYAYITCGGQWSCYCNSQIICG